MPPRIRPSQVSTISAVSPPSQSTICTRCLYQARQRQFSSTPRHNVTQQRKEMFRWLRGPGRVFRNPLPGSTNYLNAYDAEGNLLRAKHIDIGGLTGSKTTDQAANIEEGRESDHDKENSEDRIAEDGPDKGRKRTPLAEKLVKEREAARAKESSPGLPKELNIDLMPFPMNNQFRSHPVLSDELREEIYRRITEEKKSVRDVSAALGVEMRRVAAVVRLMAIEKQWEKQDKPLAWPYARAVRAMLPQTPYIPHDPVLHESINDLPLHRATNRQVFLPVPESRHFTRRDAGKVFDKDLLPAEDRIPHPELYESSKWAAEGIVTGQRIRMRREADEKAAEAKEGLERARKERERLMVKRAQTSRWEFRFREMQADSAGEDGRGTGGVGARYGLPHQDRKKGQIKVPRRVET